MLDPVKGVDDSGWWDVWVELNGQIVGEKREFREGELVNEYDIEIHASKGNYELFIKPVPGSDEKIVSSKYFTANVGDEFTWYVPIEYINFEFYNSYRASCKVEIEQFSVNEKRIRQIYQEYGNSILNKYESKLGKEIMLYRQEAIYTAKVSLGEDTLYYWIDIEDEREYSYFKKVAIEDIYLLNNVEARKAFLYDQEWLFRKKKILQTDSDFWDTDKAALCPEDWQLPTQESLKKLLSNLGYYQAIQHPNFWRYTQKNWDYLGMNQHEPTYFMLKDDNFYLSVHKGAIQKLPYLNETIDVVCHCVKDIE